MTPIYLIIALGAIIGLALDGFAGLVLGLVGGTVLTLVIGALVNTFQGGAVPRNARRRVVVNMLTKYPEVVSDAFPGQTGEGLFASLDAIVDGVGRRAASISPSPSTVMDGSVVLQALASLASDAPTDSLRRLYSCLTIQIGRDWYDNASSPKRDSPFNGRMPNPTISVLGGDPAITIPYVSFDQESDPARQEQLYLTALAGAAHLLVNKLYPTMGSRLSIESLRGICITCAEQGFQQGLATAKTTEGLFAGAELAFLRYCASFETPDAALSEIMRRFPPLTE